MSDILSRLAERYGNIAVSEDSRHESPLEHAIRVRQRMRKKQYGPRARVYDLESIQEEFNKISNDLSVLNRKGFSARALLDRMMGKRQRLNYSPDELNERIYDAFSDFASYLKYQLELNQSTHEDLSRETLTVQQKQVELLKRKDMLDEKLDELTALVSEASAELESISGMEMDAESAERRMALKQYFDNLLRDQDITMSDVLQNYDMIADSEETLLVLDFYKKVNNMVNVGQRAALGEAMLITEEYRRNRDILSRIEENARFALQVYQTVDMVKGHVESNFLASKGKIEELRKTYDSRIRQRRNNARRMKHERLTLMQKIDDSFLRRAGEYKDLKPTFN